MSIVHQKGVKLNKGDKVAILSPSNGLPGLFPWVQDYGLKRLKDDFGLIPVEYPTTRQMGSSLKDRARDIMDAFSDKEIKAIITSIGGNDQIKLLKYLDKEVIKNNPKPFLGFSDNTHLHIFLWKLGIPSYYGGSIMNQFAMQNKMIDQTVKSINNSLFDLPGLVEITACTEFTDIGHNWADESTLNTPRKFEPNEGFIFDGTKNAKGILFGGCIGSMVAEASANFLPDEEDLKDAILILESSESMIEPWVVQYLLTGLGERGILENLSGVLVGRPKTWDFSKQLNEEERKAFKQKQRDAIKTTVREYNQEIPIVFNVDFGHTDPQTLVPLGREAVIDVDNKKLYYDYS